MACHVIMNGSRKDVKAAVRLLTSRLREFFERSEKEGVMKLPEGHRTFNQTLTVPGAQP